MIRFVVASAVLTAGASAQSFTYSIDPAQSDISVNSSITLDLTGDLKGVFDAATNPGGTRTLSGLFGDPGSNAEIPLSLGLGISLDLGGAGAGSFTLIYDPASGEVSVDELVATVPQQFVQRAARRGHARARHGPVLRAVPSLAPPSGRDLRAGGAAPAQGRA